MPSPRPAAAIWPRRSTNCWPARPVSQPTTEAIGCLIGRVRKAEANSDVTYSNQIARIFQKHCVECHRPGQIGPFALAKL